MHAGGSRGARLALSTPIVVTVAHEPNSPPPVRGEGGCWSCHLPFSLLPSIQPSEDPSVPKGHCFVGSDPFLGKGERLAGAGLVGGDAKGPRGRVDNTESWLEGASPRPSSHIWLKVKLCRVPKARAGRFIVLLLPG